MKTIQLILLAILALPFFAIADTMNNPSQYNLSSGLYSGTLPVTKGGTGVTTATGTGGSTVLSIAPTLTGSPILGDYAGIGSINAANILRITGSGGFAGNTQVGVSSLPTGTSAGTLQLISFAASATSAATTYTLTDLIGLKADTNVKGSGSTVTNSYGVYVNEQTAGTNNYGLYSNVSSGTNKWNIYAIGTADNFFTGAISSKHLIGNTSTPTIAAGTGAGTGPTVSISGNDTDMQVTVTTGTTPAGTNATIATITYNATWGTTPRPTFSSANAAAAAIASGSFVAMDGASATTFTIISGTTALLASTTYKWNVHTMN